MKSLLGIAALSKAEIQSLLVRAQHYADNEPDGKLLKGRILLNLFLENSTRTRVSFEIAGKRLGADVVNMTAEGSSVKKGESFKDTLQTLNAMKPDILVLRHSENGAAETAASTMRCPVINAGDGTNEHPTQALLDALTLKHHFGKLEGLQIAIVGDIRHSRVARSNGLLLEKMGAHVKWVGPQEFLLQGIQNATTDLKSGLEGADAVMTLRIQKERFEKLPFFSEEGYFKAYGLTQEKMKLAKKEAVILHPGPMNRGVEIDGALADDPKRSLILKQVEMGVALRMACLELLLRD
jgi:aspartate carbamoyltransferase catalytic subunit